MSIAGIPVWALVLVACVVAPWVVQQWTAAHARKVDAATTELLAAIDPALPELVGRRSRRGPPSGATRDAGDA